MLLSSLKIIHLLRAHSIMHHVMALPYRWITAYFHKLGQCNCSVSSMGQMIDTIYEKNLGLKEEPSLIIEKNDGHHEALAWRATSLFRSTLSSYAAKKRKHRAIRNGTKILPMKDQSQELFYTVNPENLETDFLMEDLGLVWTNSMMSELTNKKKATHDKLLSTNGTCSWTIATEEEKLAVIGAQANNDASESSVGILTNAADKFKMLSLTNAGVHPWPDEMAV